jgi:hypothetical protein
MSKGCTLLKPENFFETLASTPTPLLSSLDTEHSQTGLSFKFNFLANGKAPRG